MTNQRFDFPFVGVSNSNGSINKLSKKNKKKTLEYRLGMSKNHGHEINRNGIILI